MFIPVVIGLAASSLLWYWLFSARYGLVNRLLMDLGIIDEPVLWLGVDANLSTWAVIVSVVWKVLGFGMILFVAAIQAVPQEINEAARVDGASAWQRTRRGDGAADDADDPPRDARQRDRLAAGLRPVLPDDRRPADEPDGHVGVLRVPQLVPVPEAGLRRRPVADPGLLHPPLHGRPDDPDEAQPVRDAGVGDATDAPAPSGGARPAPAPRGAAAAVRGRGCGPGGGATSPAPSASPCAP